jgi:hypothetical protein
MVQCLVFLRCTEMLLLNMTCSLSVLIYRLVISFPNDLRRLQLLFNKISVDLRRWKRVPRMLNVKEGPTNGRWTGI